MNQISLCHFWIFLCKIEKFASPKSYAKFLLIKKSAKLKMMRLKWFFPYKLILGRDIEWKWSHNSLAQFSHQFSIIGSSWPKRVRNCKCFDWSIFHHINQIWIEKLIRKGLKLLQMNFCVHSWLTTFIHSWWPVPLDQKESETDYDAIHLILTLGTNFGSRKRLEMVLQCHELVFSSILDHRFLLIKKSPK